VAALIIRLRSVIGPSLAGEKMSGATNAACHTHVRLPFATALKSFPESPPSAPWLNTNRQCCAGSVSSLGDSAACDTRRIRRTLADRRRRADLVSGGRPFFFWLLEPLPNWGTYVRDWCDTSPMLVGR